MAKAVCNDADLDGKDLNCDRNTFFSLRLPIAVLQEALFEKKTSGMAAARFRANSSRTEGAWSR